MKLHGQARHKGKEPLYYEDEEKEKEKQPEKRPTFKADSSKIRSVTEEDRKQERAELLNMLSTNSSSDSSTSTPLSEVIELHRKRQEELTEEIAIMVQLLKQNCIQSLSIVKDDNKQLDKIDQQADSNLNLLKKGNKNLKNELKTTNWVTSLYYAALAIGVSIFFAMYYAIKISSFIPGL